MNKLSVNHDCLLLFIFFLFIFISCNNNNNIKNDGQVQNVSINSSNPKISEDEAEKFMSNRCIQTNQSLLKIKTVDFNGTKLFMFLSSSQNGLVCISTISENALEIIASNCGTEESKMSDWNSLSDISNKTKSSMGKENIQKENKLDQNQSNNSQSLEQNSENVIGEYITQASLNKKIYFYTDPNETTKRNSFFDSKEVVEVVNIENGFGYIEFINSTGQKSVGWVKMEDLTKN